MTERFELLDRLGSGGMATVWKARDRESGHFVAVKMLHPHLAEDPSVVARFEREVGYAPASPHIVQVLGFGTRDGSPYIVMEYVAGPSLREVMAARGPLPWDEVRWIMRDIAEALAAAHAAGVVHRDVKPSNILIAPDGTAKLADFGIALGLDLTRLTHATQMGTPSYADPLGQNEPSGDVYSLGCVIYEALVGNPPFQASSKGEVIAKHLSLEPDFSRVAPSAARVLRTLLAKAKDQRLTARRLLELLGTPRAIVGEVALTPNPGRRPDTIARSEEPRTPAPPVSMPRSLPAAESGVGSPRPRRHFNRFQRATAIAGMASVLAAMAMVVFLTFRPFNASEPQDNNNLPESGDGTLRPIEPEPTREHAGIPTTPVATSGRTLPVGFYNAWIPMEHDTCATIAGDVDLDSPMQTIRNANPGLALNDSCTNLHSGQWICVDSIQRSMPGEPPCIGAVRTEGGIVVVWGARASPIPVSVSLRTPTDFPSIRSRVLSTSGFSGACFYPIDTGFSGRASIEITGGAAALDFDLESMSTGYHELPAACND